jgi:hypothetical protein
MTSKLHHTIAGPDDAPPIALVGSLGDPAAPTKCGRELADRIRDGRLDVFERAAHLASVECGEEVSDLIAAHVAQ